MQSVYSFYGSPLHLVLEDEIAEGYNRVADAFLSAQEEHYAVNGTHWDPQTAIVLNLSDEDVKAYNAVGSVINLLCDINGGLDIPEDQCTSDKLVKL